MQSTRPRHNVFQIVCAKYGGNSRLRPKHLRIINKVLKGIGFQNRTGLNRYLRNRYGIRPRKDFEIKF